MERSSKKEYKGWAKHAKNQDEASEEGRRLLRTRKKRELEIELKLEKIRERLTFCEKCGEHIMDNGECSNHWCPEQFD